MLLTIDVGNTNITLGGFKEEQLVFIARLVTNTRRTEDQYAIELLDIMKLHGVNISEVDGIIISSVVPGLHSVFKHAIFKITGQKPIMVGPGVKTGLNILIENPAQLGADLVAGAVAAIANYTLPCIIFDLGTATTVSVIDKNANLLGVVIAAGVGITLDSLTSRTALLPHVSIDKPETVIGKNSIHSMQSGLVYGTAAMLDGLVDRIEEEIGEKASLIATGGLAGEIVDCCKNKITVNENLLLEGLRLIYNKNK